MYNLGEFENQQIAVGIDLVEIARIDKSIQNDSFVKRIFTENEIEYCRKKHRPAESFAGRFCAKEAFSKALGTGFRQFEFTDIEILNTPLGRPYLIIRNSALNFLENRVAEVSISHSDLFATAIVIIYKKIK